MAKYIYLPDALYLRVFVEINYFSCNILPHKLIDDEKSTNNGGVLKTNTHQ